MVTTSVFTVLCYCSMTLYVGGLPPTPKGHYAVLIEPFTCLEVECGGDVTSLTVEYRVKCFFNSVSSMSPFNMDESKINSYVVDPSSEGEYNDFVRHMKSACRDHYTVGDNDTKELTSQKNNEELKLTFGGSERTLLLNGTCY
ncbi:hypothetical protein FOL47_005002 [Perkinsus chesapeaki]|uniref:Uncharacterized protein n=1 Tax=Perkinsus chesapeaki TaxID=330153 RepID=A0A7J6LZM2_PERCH|nr:hypothetical protein FOL47_005002 [Perkinsus chesapeaki]